MTDSDYDTDPCEFNTACGLIDLLRGHYHSVSFRLSPVSSALFGPGVIATLQQESGRVHDTVLHPFEGLHGLPEMDPAMEFRKLVVEYAEGADIGVFD